MKLSVIIPTHDREQNLLRTLSALGQQTLPEAELEVVVVDDGSSEETRRKLRPHREAPGRIWIEKDQGGLASARNAGARRAHGEILHFLDDDVVPAPDTCEQHVLSHEQAAEPVAVVGSLPFPTEIRCTTFMWYLERSGHFDLYADPGKYPEGRPPMPPMNGNSSIRNDLFRRIGGYDEGFRQYGSEDLDLGYRLAQAGVRFVYNPRAVGWHHHVKDFPRFCVDMERAGESLIDVYRKHPEIKASKKIDVVEDRFRDLPGRKRMVKAVMAASFAAPWMLALPRAVIRAAGGVYALRRALVPFYRWVAHYHYAVGMRRQLAAGR